MAAISGSSGPPVAKITIPAASIIPQGVGAPPPPGLDPKKGKLMCIKVRMLDDTVGVFHLGHKALGQALFDEVCRHLNLLECDYFGLEFLDCFTNKCWLDKEKSILKQITLARSDARFFFVVKFYTPTPADLEEEYTRYLFAMQIKRDLASGQFLCNENTAALMASYIVQSECGDFSSDDYHDHTYLSAVRFVPNQSTEFEKKVMDNHKKLIGMSPAEADLALLETARRSEFYGVKFHGARDIEGTPVSLAVLHCGIKVYHHLSCASTFSWGKLRKLSFKRKKLLIKLLPESCVYYKDTIEFTFETRNECKMFWKKAVEHHAFFRCSDVPATRQQSKFFTKGSSFRYSGRTQKQLIDYVREHHKRREPFTRPLHSAKTKNINEDRLLPTPVSSLPGTLVRENGNLSTNSTMAIREPPYCEDYYQSPFGTAMMREQENYAQDQPDETRWNQFIGNNNEHNRSTPLTTVIPPTPDTPQLKRKMVKTSASTPAVTRQQITFHFPVTEISPDSPSSTSDFGPRPGDMNIIIDSRALRMPQEQPPMDEWAAPPTPSSPTLPPMSPGVETDGIEEDNISEDSYHLAENEQIAQRILQDQQSSDDTRIFISTSLPPMSVLRGNAESGGCTCVDKHQHPLLQTFSDRPSSSVDVVFPSNSIPTQGFKVDDTLETHISPQTTSPPRSPTRGLSGPLPGRILPKGPIIIARTKPIPPPKPKMGLGQLERSGRGEYSTTPTPVSQSTPTPLMEPMIVSQSTITTTEITVKKIMDVCEPISTADLHHFADVTNHKPKQEEIQTSSVSKRVDFALPNNEDSIDDADSSLPSGRISPSPPTITNAVFPSDTDSVCAVPPPPLPPVVPLIEVQSEECPEIKHKIVNGDIPYILHVRHVKKGAAEPKLDDYLKQLGATTFSTFKDAPTATSPTRVRTETATDRGRDQTTPSSQDSPETSKSQRRPLGRRKSFDLVPRKRLPSPASFSSQDHSVSPDSEHDVAGYVSKFRITSKKAASQTNVATGRSTSKRTDPRRMTQPIQPKSIMVKHPKSARSQPCITIAGEMDEDESGDELIGLDAPSLHEGMDLLEKLDTDRISIGSGGETTSTKVPAESRTVGVRFAPEVQIDTPFIDDRTSSESLISADYDNLPPVRRSHGPVARSRGISEQDSTESNGQSPPSGV